MSRLTTEHTHSTLLRAGREHGDAESRHGQHGDDGDGVESAAGEYVYRKERPTVVFTPTPCLADAHANYARLTFQDTLRPMRARTAAGPSRYPDYS